MNKYHAKKVRTPDGVFDSQKEYRRYCELRILERAGIVTNLQRQVRFALIPAQRGPDTIGARGGVKRGKIIEKAVYYVADFVYDMDGKHIVEDCKGVRTDAYIIKRKLMLKVYGIRITET